MPFKANGGASRLAKLMADNLTAPRSYNIKAEDREAAVYLYGGIGGWFGVDAQSFVREINELDVDVLNLHVNCPGGDIFDARAMMAALRRHSAKVVAHIDGLAASAATFLVMAADEVRMAQGGRFMIHRGWTLQIGNMNDMRETADLLEGLDQDIASDYAKKTRKKKNELLDLMDAETWLTADESFEMGFVDEVFDPAEAVENRYDLSAYNKAPDDFPKANIAAEADGEQGAMEISVKPDLTELKDLVARVEAAVAKLPGGEEDAGVVIASKMLANGTIYPSELETGGLAGNQPGESITPLEQSDESSKAVIQSMEARRRRLSLLERELSL